MSKSIGNIVSIRELLDRDLGDAFRLMVLQSHYRSPLTYTEESLMAAQRGLERLRGAATATAQPASTSVSADGLNEAISTATNRFHEAMDDDFDSPRAIAALFDLGRAINRERDAGISLP